MSDCRLKIISKLVSKAKEATEGRPSFSFDEKAKVITVNIGEESKAKSMLQASQMAVNVAKELNKAVNSDRQLDDVFVPGLNKVFLQPTIKYIDGMMEFDRIKESEKAYNDFLSYYPSNKDTIKTPSILDEELSLQALDEQESKLEDYISEGIVKQICKL